MSSRLISRRVYGDYDAQHPDLAAVLDDLPLWSAAFGLRLLECATLRHGIVAVDIGSGTGFPAVELAERLGRSGQVHVIEPWPEGLTRIRQKVDVRGVANVVLHDAVAERLPLPDRTADLIVSNNGLNNVEDLDRALAECARVARPGAQMVFTWNLPDTMHEFYTVLAPVLTRALGDREEADRRIREHIFAKRKSLSYMRERFERAGFSVERVIEDAFSLRFVDGTAMFDQFLMRNGFIGPWLELIDEPHRRTVFGDVEERLNAIAAQQGHLALSIPFACLDSRRR